MSIVSTPYFWFVFSAYLIGFILLFGLLIKSYILLKKSKKEIKRSDLINQENAGERLFLRVERQTIRRLPESSSIVFTIRVHIDPLSSIQNDFTLLSDLKMALSHLNADLKTYKSIDQIEMPLQSWLDHRINKLN